MKFKYDKFGVNSHKFRANYIPPIFFKSKITTTILTNFPARAYWW